MPENPLPLTSGIYLLGTPIGNLEDISLRALRILAGCDVLACEDTRVTRKIFQRHNLPPPKAIIACHSHNEAAAARRLVAMAGSGKAVVYASDAGMPGVSDPGSELARQAVAAGVRLEAVPGPSACTTALALSGLASSTFIFLGFPPRRDSRLNAILQADGQSRHALVFYESPRRVERLLRLAAGALGRDRPAAVCLELTKKFERVERGSLEELAERFAGFDYVKGEATLVIAGKLKQSDKDDDDNDHDNEHNDSAADMNDMPGEEHEP